MQVARSGYPIEHIVVGVLGERPITESCIKHIVVDSDHFTN